MVMMRIVVMMMTLTMVMMMMTLTMMTMTTTMTTMMMTYQSTQSSPNIEVRVTRDVAMWCHKTARGNRYPTVTRETVRMTTDLLVLLLFVPCLVISNLS